MTSLKVAVKTLHARKDKHYGAAWKRRGERISVLPNIARKIDRLVVFLQANAEMRDEPIIDTAVDLLVYCGKYLLFLGDLDHKLLIKLHLDGPQFPLSEHNKNFDQLLDRVDLETPPPPQLSPLVTAIEETFEALWPMADGGSTADERFSLAYQLWSDTAKLVAFIVHAQPDAIKVFIESEAQP